MQGIKEGPRAWLRNVDTSVPLDAGQRGCQSPGDCLHYRFCIIQSLVNRRAQQIQSDDELYELYQEHLADCGLFAAAFNAAEEQHLAYQAKNPVPHLADLLEDLEDIEAEIAASPNRRVRQKLNGRKTVLLRQINDQRGTDDEPF